MNRIIFISIVGLGALSAAGFAGSNGQRTSVVAAVSQTKSAPVVLVTQPDGQCVVAHCISVSSCDPKAGGRSGTNTFTFTTHGGSASAPAASAGEGHSCGSGTSTNSSSSNSGCLVGAGSSSGTGATADATWAPGASNTSNGTGGFVGFGSSSGTGAAAAPAQGEHASGGGEISGPGASASAEAPAHPGHGPHASHKSHPTPAHPLVARSEAGATCASPSIAVTCDPKKAQKPCETVERVTEVVPAEPQGLFARILSTRVSDAEEVAEAPNDERLVSVREFVDVNSSDSGEGNEYVVEALGVDAEALLAQAREQLSENQESMREAWQRAAEESRVAQERAREAYEEAMEHYREAMQAAQERAREVRQRALAESRAQADRAAQKSSRKRPGFPAPLPRDDDAALEERVERLEAAARGRGVQLEKLDGSLEERVARLEEHMAHEKSGVPLLKGLFARAESERDAAATAPRVLRLNSLVAPRPPEPASPPTPPKAPSRSNTFRLRMGPDAPLAPGAPEPRALLSEERAELERAVSELRREATRLREELGHMRAQVERLPREGGGR